MGRRYAVDGQGTNTASTSLLGLAGTAAIRTRLYDIIVGSDATPADNAAEYVIQRFTADGSGTLTPTPQALDSGDPAAAATSIEDHTAEPTYTANAIMLQWAQNQRATFRWVAAPNGEIVSPASTNGIALQVITVAGSAINTNVCFHYEE